MFHALVMHIPNLTPHLVDKPSEYQWMMESSDKIAAQMVVEMLMPDRPVDETTDWFG